MINVGVSTGIEGFSDVRLQGLPVCKPPCGKLGRVSRRADQSRGVSLDDSGDDTNFDPFDLK